MASQAAPSCRLVFCLLISAAVLRPGEQGPRSSPGPTRAGEQFPLVPDPGLAPREQHPRRAGEVQG